MKSPFPGMDPYLEASPFWKQLHDSLINGLQRELKSRVPTAYSVCSDVNFWLGKPDAASQMQEFEPDAFLPSPEKTGGAAALATMNSPVTTLLPGVRRKGNRFLKLQEVLSGRVVTIIELVVPSMKASNDAYESYRFRRNSRLIAGSNLVEIDLLRTGKRMPLGDPRPPVADYYAVVCRAADFPKTAIWPFSVRDALPDIPIPLNPEDGIVRLPLQACFEWAYSIGPYDKEVDYTQPPRVPLKEPDAAWARELVATHNL